MKNNLIRLTVLRPTLCWALLLCAILAAPSLAQSTKSWTTVGVAGDLSEDDLNHVLLGGGIATLSSTAPANTTVKIHYNVVAVDGLFDVGGLVLTARFRDSGANERVILRLWQYDLNSGVKTMLAELDSNDYAGDTNFQTRTVVECDAPNFNFATKGYFIEADLSKAAAAGNPRLGIIQLSHGANCIP